MTWEYFYLTCFVLGLVLCALSLFTGGGHIHGGHVHFGGHTHVRLPHTGSPGHSPSHGASNGVSPINGFTLTAFLCWFGGIGFLLRTHTVFYAPLVLLISTISGIAGAALIFWFLASVLLPRERALTAEETEITGVVGRVTGPLHPGGTGEIVYSQLGARRSAPARSEDGSAIPRDAEVVVLRYEHGIAYVRPWQDMDL
jgi:membrane protein implicated in regulation of membrane protease activity